MNPCQGASVTSHWASPGPRHAVCHSCPAAVGAWLDDPSSRGFWWSRDRPRHCSVQRGRASRRAQVGRTYLKAPDDEQRVDAVCLHLSSDLLQVLSGERPATVRQRRSDGCTRRPPGPIRAARLRGTEHGRSALSSLWLVASSLGGHTQQEWPGITSQKVNFQKKTGRSFTAVPKNCTASLG